MLLNFSQVNELQATLRDMEPKLIKTQADVELMIVQITKDKVTAAETKAVVEVEEASASKKASETKAIADDAQRDLDEALPGKLMSFEISSQCYFCFEFYLYCVNPMYGDFHT